MPIKNLDKIPTNKRTPELAIEPTRKVASEATPEVATEPTKATKAKAKTNCEIYPLKTREGCLNKIKNEEKNINEQIFGEYFSYQSSSSLDLFEDN